MNQCRQEERLMERSTLAFPSKHRMLGLIKGASGGIESHPLGACLEHLPEHADRGFQACHAGLFRLRKGAKPARTFVNDPAPMMLRGIGRMRLKDSRWAWWALHL